ncbi:Uncharacterised protein [Mycobacterium tuberculosis]|nr:Uncharacterised protein [Mycobacterium tuberculosis]
MALRHWMIRASSSRNSLLAMRLRSGAATPRSSNEVASGSTSSGAWVTLSPTPSTTNGCATSARMPANLPPRASTSLGHLRPVSAGGTAIRGATESSTARPAASDSQPHACTGTSTTRTPTDRMICARAVAAQPRP